MVRKPLFGDLPRAIMCRIDRDQGISSPSLDRFFLPAADPTSNQPHDMGHRRHSRHRRGSPPTPLRSMLSMRSFSSTSRRSSASMPARRSAPTVAIRRRSNSLPSTPTPPLGDGLPELTSLQKDMASKTAVVDALAASDGAHALDVEDQRPTAGRPRGLNRHGSIARSVDTSYRALPAHLTPTSVKADGQSGASAWAGVMPDAAAAPPSPANRANPESRYRLPW